MDVTFLPITESSWIINWLTIKLLSGNDPPKPIKTLKIDPPPPPPPAKWPVPLRVINNQPLEIFLHVCVPLEFWNPTFCITNYTKIILNKSITLRTAPWQSPPYPWLPLTNKGLWYYNRYAYFRRNVALFSPWPEQQSETTYIERPNNIFCKTDLIQLI